jgi:crossover junction endodeoxyribonuclease RuvC
MSSPLRILGIDPGLNTTGYAVIESRPAGVQLVEAGVVRGADGGAAVDIGQRLKVIYDGVIEVIEQLAPQVLAVEQLYAHYDHPRTAILMAHARGAILLAGGIKNLKVISYAATEIKKAVTGSGRAGKEQMQLAMLREFRLTQLPEPHDVADALAIALCHHYRQSIESGQTATKRGMGVRLAAFDLDSDGDA